MSAESTPEPGNGEDRHHGPEPPAARAAARPRQAHRARSTAWIAAGIVVLGGTGAGYLYFKLNGNIKSVDIDQVLGTDRPARSTTAPRTSWSWARTPAPAPTRSSAAAPTTAAPARTPR